MSLQKITYEDKVATETLPDVENKSKVSDTDMNQIKTVVNSIIDNFTTKTVIDMVYPVGSLYFSNSSTNPGTLWSGTTWVAEAEGRCIIGANSNYVVGSTGGSTTVDLSHTHNGPSHSHTVNSHTHTTAGHALTVGEMPAHNHSVWMNEAGSHSHTGRTLDIKIGNINAAYDAARRIGTSYGYEGQITLDAGSHSHSCGTNNNGSGYSHSHGDTGASAPGTTASGTGATSSSLGSTSIMQPYVAMYIWRRTA